MSKKAKHRKARVHVPGHDSPPLSTQERILLDVKLEAGRLIKPPPGMFFGILLEVTHKNGKVMGWVRSPDRKGVVDSFFSQYWDEKRWERIFKKLDPVYARKEAGHVEVQVVPAALYDAGEEGLEHGAVNGIVAGNRTDGNGEGYGQVLALQGHRLEEFQFRFLPLGVLPADIRPGTLVTFSPHKLVNGNMQARNIRPQGVDVRERRVQAVRSLCGVMAKRQVTWCGMVLSLDTAGGESGGEVGVILFGEPVTCALRSFHKGVRPGEIKVGDVVEFEHEMGRAGRFYAVNARPGKIATK